MIGDVIVKLWLMQVLVLERRLLILNANNGNIIQKSMQIVLHKNQLNSARLYSSSVQINK